MQLLAVGMFDLDIHERQQVVVGYWDEDQHYRAVQAVPGVEQIDQIPRPPVEVLKAVPPIIREAKPERQDRGRAPRR